jgi:glycosyltransferase EpsF
LCEAPSGPFRQKVPDPFFGRLHLGFLGRFCKIKGPDLLLRAAAILRERGLPTVCELAGPIADGDRDWAERLLAEHAGPDCIYRGVLREQALRDWLCALDALVIPSRCLETGPLTLLEAWDQGVPVIGADLGGIREFMVEAGLEDMLFTPDDPAALAETAMRLVTCSKAGPEVSVPEVAELATTVVSLYRVKQEKPHSDMLDSISA